MTCMHCVGRVEEALKAVNGVSSVMIDLETKPLLLMWSPVLKKACCPKLLQKLAIR